MKQVQVATLARRVSCFYIFARKFEIWKTFNYLVVRRELRIEVPNHVIVEVWEFRQFWAHLPKFTYDAFVVPEGISSFLELQYPLYPTISAINSIIGLIDPF